MKEYILKDDVIKIANNSLYEQDAKGFCNSINSLPTTTTQYEIGEIYNMSDDQITWIRGILVGYLDNYNQTWKFIRQLKEEPDDLKQARLTLEKYGYSIAKNS